MSRAATLPQSGVSAVVELRLVGRVAIERQAAVLARRKDRPRGGGVVALRVRRRAAAGRAPRSDETRAAAAAVARAAAYTDTRCGRLNMRVSGAVRRYYSPAPWTPSSRSRRRSSRCACPADLVRRGSSARAPRSPPGPRRSPPTRSPQVLLPGERRPAGATPSFRVYYLGGALLTAALLGAGSLLLVGRRRWGPPRSSTQGSLSGSRSRCLSRRARGNRRAGSTGRPRPVARARLAIAGELARDARRRRRRAHDVPRRPLGNALILAGVGVAALGSGLAGLGVGALAPLFALRRSSSTRASSRLRGSGRRRLEPRPAFARRSAHAARPRRRRRRRRARREPRRSRPATPPCATSASPARAATALRPCRAPSARASGTGSVERRPPSSNRATARSCATASPATWPTTSARTWTYQTVSGETIARFGAKSTVPNRSQPRPNGSDASVIDELALDEEEREVVRDEVRGGDRHEREDEVGDERSRRRARAARAAATAREVRRPRPRRRRPRGRRCSANVVEVDRRETRRRDRARRPSSRFCQRVVRLKPSKLVEPSITATKTSVPGTAPRRASPVNGQRTTIRAVARRERRDPREQPERDREALAAPRPRVAPEDGHPGERPVGVERDRDRRACADTQARGCASSSATKAKSAPAAGYRPQRSGPARAPAAPRAPALEHPDGRVGERAPRAEHAPDVAEQDRQERQPEPEDDVDERRREVEELDGRAEERRPRA